jgi:hypothetical protein
MMSISRYFSGEVEHLPKLEPDWVPDAPFTVVFVVDLDIYSVLMWLQSNLLQQEPCLVINTLSLALLRQVTLEAGLR